MPAPFEVFASPFTAYLGTDGLAEPLNLSIAPPVGYEVLGASGSKNYDEEGVTYVPGESLSDFRGLGATGIRKRWRTEEDGTFKMTVYDATPEHVAKVLGTALVTTASAALVSASKAAPLNRGQVVQTVSLLLRSDNGGAVSDAQKAQWWVPRCSIEIGEMKVAHKGEPMGTELTFVLWEHETLKFGNYRVASANPTP